jgi:hypothetical protein
MLPFVHNSCSPQILNHASFLQGFKIDISSKQIIVDFVNQTAIQSSFREGEPPQDRTNLAERLGLMNSRWQLLASDIMEMLKKFEQNLSKWEEYDTASSNLLQWFTDQETRLQRTESFPFRIFYSQFFHFCFIFYFL